MDEAQLPKVDRTDAGTILVSDWLVDSPERQRAAAEALHAGWRELATTPGFLSLSSFGSLDGDHILNYAQWTDDESHRRFARTDRPELVARIDAAVPGIERPGVRRYRLHRSVDFKADWQPGCVVVIQFDTDSATRAEELVDAIIARQDRRPEGACYAHFHIGKDGTRMLNYAGFRDVRSHEIAARSPAMVGPGGIRDAIAAMPGVTGLGFTRYRLLHSLANPRA
ncbi:MAG: antibiotic biosynthesis monooxygenase family protein [Stackebrandtia sp.]